MRACVRACVRACEGLGEHLRPVPQGDACAARLLQHCLARPLQPQQHRRRLQGTPLPPHTTATSHHLATRTYGKNPMTTGKCTAMRPCLLAELARKKDASSNQHLQHLHADSDTAPEQPERD